MLRLLLSLVMILLAIPVSIVVGAVHYAFFRKAWLFKQARILNANQDFIVYKLRTLFDFELSFAQKRWIHFLRKSSFDELPQLFQTIMGPMALVGPRPLVPVFREDIIQACPERFSAKPGLTGWAQINGGRALSLQQKLQLDAYYIKHRSVWLDLKIIALTIHRWPFSSNAPARDLMER